MEVLFLLLDQFPKLPCHFHPKSSSLSPVLAHPITVPESSKIVYVLSAAFSDQQGATYSRGVMTGEMSRVIDLG